MICRHGRAAVRRHLHRCHRGLLGLRTPGADLLLPPGRAAVTGLPAGGRGGHGRFPDRRCRPCRLGGRSSPQPAGRGFRLHRRARAEGAAAWLPRPIEPVHVLRALDELVELRLSAPEPPSAMMDLDPLEADTQRGDIDDSPRAAEAPAAPSRPRGGGGREVLLVEDSPIARQFLKQRLQHLGYRVLDCASGEAALEILSKRTFGMVFLDVVLGPPGSVDGLQLCQRLKQRGAQGGGLRTVVVIVTGLDGATDRVRGSLAGCDAYLTKPLHESEFIATLLQVDPAFEWSADASSAAA
ncbi:response regulator [Piscinibacter aquaticus]|uniref:Response regulator n=1 Tax=Piscinibacter aquaticus TaxID=392597 RepID=A0A5C6U6B9_9BURK|nr:response regulator [Piscinibacter aquaticus]